MSKKRALLPEKRLFISIRNRTEFFKRCQETKTQYHENYQDEKGDRHLFDAGEIGKRGASDLSWSDLILPEKSVDLYGNGA